MLEKNECENLSRYNNCFQILLSSNKIEILQNYEKYFGNCRSVSEFEKMEELGEGTYGKVCKSV